MARPKGSGKGLVVVGLRIEPELYDAIQQIAAEQRSSVAEVGRGLLRQVLTDEQRLDAMPAKQAGYQDGLRRGRQDFHRAVNKAWADLDGGET